MRDHPVRPVAEVEFSTDAPPRAEDLAAAYAEFIALTEGDRVAAAVLAVGAILGDTVQRRATE